MKFLYSASPNLRGKLSTRRIMLELMIGLLVVYGFSLFYYFTEHGMAVALHSLILMATSLIVMAITEVGFAYFTKQDIIPFLSNSFGWITAIILTLMCPITITPFALGVATFCAILFGKLLFGGFGQNIFNPAALGRAIVLASFTGVVANVTEDVITGATITTKMANDFNWLVVDPNMIEKLMKAAGGLQNLFVGFYPGGIGETSALLLCCVGIFFIWRKVIDWRLPIIYLSTIFVLGSVIAWYSGMSDWLWYPLFQLFSGGVMFAAVFMLTDPVTSPTSAAGKCIFALGAAIITVLIRIKANLPEGVLYSILIMNMLTPMIERAFDGKQYQILKKAYIVFAVISALGIGSVVLAASQVEPAKEKVKEVIKITPQDEYVNSLEATIESEVDNGDGTKTFTVSAQGFAAKEGPNLPDYNHGFEPNVFEIKVDTATNKVVYLKATKIGDTEYLGDKLLNAKYTVQFEGLDLQSEFEVSVNDAITGATYSAKSSVRALLEVRKALGF